MAGVTERNRCPECYQPVGRNSTDAVETASGRTHARCAKPTSVETLLRNLFGEPLRARERAATTDMAASVGHSVHRERRRGANGNRAWCDCGWATHWGSSPDIAALANAHRKDAAVYG